jgi:K+-sensing histidine kinase KdpD
MIFADTTAAGIGHKGPTSDASCKDKGTAGQGEDLIASLNHELRTPLTAIRAFSSILLEEPDMERAQRQQFLAIVVEETERLTSIVNRLLPG